MATNCVLIGTLVALAMDCSIYQRLGATLRAHVFGTPDVTYRSIVFGRLAVVRLLAVIAAGVSGGLAFKLQSGPLWIGSCLLFAVAHTSLYALLSQRR